MENENEVVLPQEDTELELELETPETPQEETVEQLKEKLAAETEARRQLTARAKEAEAKLKSSLQTQKKDVPDDIKQAVQKLTLAETKRQFGYDNGLSPEETDAVFAFTPNPTKETLKNPFVEGGLAKLRSQKRVSENTPSSSSRSGRPFTIKPDATLAEKQAEHEKWTKEWKPRR